MDKKSSIVGRFTSSGICSLAKLAVSFACGPAVTVPTKRNRSDAASAKARRVKLFVTWNTRGRQTIVRKRAIPSLRRTWRTTNPEGMDDIAKPKVSWRNAGLFEFLKVRRTD